MKEKALQMKRVTSTALFALLMVMFAPLAMFGQDELTVFEGTETSREVPMYVYYFDDFTRAQTVYPATELEDMAGGQITAIKFYTTSDDIPYTTVSTFNIYLTEVEDASISSFVDRSDATTVYSGTGEFVAVTGGGEITITFSTPYVYHGGNLLFGCDNITDSEWKGIKFYGQDRTGVSVSGYDANGLENVSPTQRNFIPKITFFYEPGEAPTCLVPSALMATDVTSNSAQLDWTNGGLEEAWEIYVSNSNVAPTYHTTGKSITEKPYSLIGLNSETIYYVWIRAVCEGNDNKSFWSETPVSFTTIPQTSVTITLENGYTDDFEDNLNWHLINGDLTNAWAWGSASNNGGGTALYVSNDGGETNAYDINASAMVYATKIFTLGEGAYQFSYDWRANGETYTSSSTGTPIPCDYLRVALVPANTILIASAEKPSDFGYNTLPAGWVALDGGSQLNQSTDWITYSEVVNISTTGDYKVVFAWRNDSSYGTQPPAAIDNFSISVSQYNPPTDLQVSNIVFNSAQISWTNGGSEEAWEIYVSQTNDAPIYHTTGTPITEKPYTLIGLQAENTYYVWVRANYGDEGLSGWCVTPASFTTIPQTPVVITEENGYTDDFEDNLNWNLINGNRTNAWAWGTATNNGGDKALYVSNDGGLTNAYSFNDTTVVYATKLFTLTKGSYEFSYDWIANGEASTNGNYQYDYLRVVLVPSGTILTASASLPSGLSFNSVPADWIALDGGSQLNLSTEWSTKTVTPINITAAGDYKVVFVWRNDLSEGNNPPAAIDNFSITKLPCMLPVDITAIGAFTTAELSWIEAGYATQWNLQWRAIGASEWNTVSNLNETSYSLTNLTPNTIYEYRVQSDCADEYWSEPIIFTTHCESYDVAPLTTFIEGFESDDFPPACWESMPYGSAKHWSRVTDHIHSGPASAYSYWYGPIYLNMPVINISQEALYAELSFWSRVEAVSYYSGGTYGNHDGLSIVKVSTDYGMTWTQLWCPTIEELPTTATWERIALDLTSYKNQDILITFEYQGTNAHGWYIDDVAVTVYDKIFVGGNAEDATAWFNADNWQPEDAPTIEQNAFITAPAVIAESPTAAMANIIGLSEQGALTIADGGQLMTNNEVAATVKKNIVGYGNSEGGYYLVSNPLANTISPVNAGFITETSYDLYDWNYFANDGLEWRNYKDKTFNLYNGWGVLYANKSDVELSFNDTIRANNTPETRTPSCSNGYEFSGWSLYGNPFVCDAYLSTEATGMAFYRMNATGDGFETASGAIHPLEGFFVQTPTSGQTLTISREAPAQRGQLNMNLSRNNKQLDNAIVIFGEGQNLGKMSFRENGSKVYMPLEGKDCSAVFTSGTGEMPVSFKAESNGTYTLDFSNEAVTFNYLHLIDNLTGNDVDLLQTPTYTFEAKTTDYASRFKLVFVCGDTDADDDFAFYSNGSFVINNEGQATLQVVDVTGRIVKSENINGCANVKVNAAAGVYMLRLVNGENEKVQKVVVR